VTEGALMGMVGGTLHRLMQIRYIHMYVYDIYIYIHIYGHGGCYSAPLDGNTVYTYVCV